MSEPPASERASLFDSREVAEAWQRGEATRTEAFGPATELMLDLAGVRPGCRVLDVAAGSGGQTLLAARRVGPNGYVLATDVSASMLELAAEAARAAGFSQVETRVVDARALDLEPASFDAAICRNGLMVIPEPSKVLAGIVRALRPGGRLAALVFSSPAKNPYAALPPAIVRRLANLPPSADEPGLFSLGDPHTLAGAFEQAGFHNVEIHAVPVARRFPSTAAAIQGLRDTFPILRELMTPLSEDQRQLAWQEIERALRQFEGPSGFEAPGESLIAVGTS
jgi:ubiquinone/menaquinone biosynthesis C-methylase UbiE